jgi:hypothetical protein
MSDIPDEAYPEAMDEIARLTNEILELGHRVKLSKYQELQALVRRAANALEAFENEFNRSPREQSYPSCRELIAELRKAAQ